MIRAALISLAFCASAHAGPVPWRADYAAARSEAVNRKLPVVIVIGAENCPRCKLQDDTTHADPTIVAALTGRAIPVKIAGNASLAFVKALGVTTYPTTVIAAPDGKILDFLSGYTSAERLNGSLAKHAPAPDPVLAARRAADELAEASAKLYRELGELHRAAGREPEAAKAFARAAVVAPKK